jgi:hypothetical protein
LVHVSKGRANDIEHPELVAERMTWAKPRAMADGAELASVRLW